MDEEDKAPSEAELEAAFSGDELAEENAEASEEKAEPATVSAPEVAPVEAPAPVLTPAPAPAPTPKSTKKETNVPFIVTLCVMIVLLLGGALFVKFGIVDKKDGEITSLKKDADVKNAMIDQLGSHIGAYRDSLDSYRQSLSDSNADLEQAAKELENANTMLGYMLGQSSEQIVSRYMLSSEDFVHYNFFDNGINDNRYRLAVTMRNTETDYIYDEQKEVGSEFARYTTLNKTYQKLFGMENSLPRDTSLNWCGYAMMNLRYDGSLYDGTGGYISTSTPWSEENPCYQRSARYYAYKTGKYYTTEEGFAIEMSVMFGDYNADDDSYHVKLTDGSETTWGGPTCGSTGEETVEEYIDKLPVYVFKFKQDNGSTDFVLINIERK